jgi:hypothetical protein
MASFPDLRPSTRSAKAESTAVGRFRRRVILAVSAALLLTAFLAVSELATLRGKKASDASAYLTRTLGPPLDSARLVRRPERGTTVDFAKPSTVSMNRKGGTISLSAAGTGAAPWRHFAHGVTRSTPFGAETITIAPGQTEQFLTVDKHHGTRTWEWNLGTKLEPTMSHNGLIELASSKGAAPEYELMPAAILDTDGRNITPSGLRWALKKADGSWRLRLKLDDTAAATTPPTR